MFGMGATVNEQAFSGAQTLVDVIGLIAEPDRKRLTEQLRQLHEALKRIEAGRAALTAHERQLLDKEKQIAAAEAALAKREEAVIDKELRAQALLHRAEDAKAQLDELKAEVRKNLAAA
jgi:hypothetical protein